MTSSFSPNRNFEEPANGDYVGTWNTPVNGNFTAIDSCFGAITSVSLSNADVSLTTAQLQCFRLSFVGALTSNVSVSFPAGAGGIFEVSNSTTGNFTVTLNNANGGTSIILPQRILLQVSCDGTNVVVSANAIPVGTVLTTAASTADPGFLLCYGQALSRTIYAALYARIGTAYGAGDGSTTFNIPDERGRASFGKDDMGGTPAGRITIAGGNFDGTVLGGSGGQQSNVVNKANLANFTLPATTEFSPSGQSNMTVGQGSWQAGADPGPNLAGNGTYSIGWGDTTTWKTTVASGGSSTPLPTLSNALIYNKQIKY